ncbi:MAG: GAF and ANTAR domain-containing protein [Williamsia herbipolensis]|nr:GAF and ANTAR domain-containing protein [Williamsia herbipolensis]
MSDVIDNRPDGRSDPIDEPDREPSVTAETLVDTEALDLELSDVTSSLAVVEILARSLHVRDASLEDTLAAVVRAAVAVVPGTRDAGLNLMVRGRFSPQAVYGQAPPPLDALQRETGTGPCIDASREQATKLVTDMATETRWPEFSVLAKELGVRSMLCVPLWVDDRRLGSLSLYSAQPDAYGPDQERVAALLATQAAIAIAVAQRADNLTQALVNRDEIGQAKGVLMERLRITPDEAFAVLSATSQRLNRKLTDVASELTRTGALPGS